MKHLSVDVYTYNQIKNKDCVFNDVTIETFISWCIHIQSNNKQGLCLMMQLLKHLSVDVYKYNHIKNKDCVFNDVIIETFISWCIHLQPNKK